jgi:hypothetical protein
MSTHSAPNMDAPGKIWRTAQSISDSLRDSFPFGNPQELKAFVRQLRDGI